MLQSKTRPFLFRKRNRAYLRWCVIFVAKTGLPLSKDHAPSRAGVRKREHDALPRHDLGPGIVKNYPTWMRAY